MEAERLDKIIEEHGRDPANLLAILQDIQKQENYLPKETLKELGKKMNVPLSRIYSLATFFASFSLKERGKHICTVCLGTACHVRGAPRLVEHIEREFAVKAGGTTPDKELSLETVNCVGACALGPLIIFDGEYHGNMTPARLDKILRPAKKED